MNNRRKFFKQLGVGLVAIAGFSSFAKADKLKLVNTGKYRITKKLQFVDIGLVDSPKDYRPKRSRREIEEILANHRKELTEIYESSAYEQYEYQPWIDSAVQDYREFLLGKRRSDSKKLTNESVSCCVPNETYDPQGIVSYIKDNGPENSYLPEDYKQEMKRRGILKPRYKIVFRNGSKMYFDSNPFIFKKER